MKKTIPIFLFLAIFLPKFCVGQQATISGVAAICKFDDTNFQLNNPFPGATAIIWSISGDGTINNAAAPQTVSLPAGALVQANFSNVGVYQICAQAVGGSVNGTSVCKSVSVFSNIILTNLPPVLINSAALPYTWPVDGSVITQVGGYNLQAAISSYLGCDSFVRQIIIIKPALEGTIFFDENANGIKEAQEPFVGGKVTVTDGNGNIKGVFDKFGKYQLDLALDWGDKISFSSNDPGVVAMPSFRTFVPGLSIGYDFALSNVAPDFGIDLNNLQIFQPGFSTELTLFFSAINTTSTTKIKLVVPNQLQFLDANPLPNGVSGDTIFWQISTGASAAQKFTIHVKTKIGTIVGSQVTVKSFVDSFAGETNLTNNGSILTRMVFGAFDPNAKETSHPTISPSAIADGNTAIEYVLHFQNTGNFKATNVFLIDSLANFYDLSSLKIIRASHACTWNLTGNVLRFDFKDIQLPDSIADFLGSMGWVKFSIKPLPTLAPDTKIKNFCDIYFDFNAPVRTQDAVTWVTPFNAGGQIDPNGLGDLELFPNPTTNWLVLKWQNPAETDGRVYLVDKMGVPRFQEIVPAGAQKIKLSWTDLTDGQYWVVLQIGTKRLVKPVILRFGTSDPTRKI